MNDWKLPWNASCLCGRVKMRITAAPIMSMACHCRGCQKLTSGPYSLTLMLPGDGFAQSGATEIGALHRPESEHHYCAHCKSWVYTRAPALGARINFRATMLDDASWVAPFVESYLSEKLPGVVSGAKHGFEKFPPPESYGALMEAYAREGARP